MSVLKRYTGTEWEELGGGGSSSLLVAETVVSGSAVTSVTFSGLDGNAAGGYYLDMGCINALASAITLKLYINGDTTDTNYYRQYIYADSTSISANRSNLPKIASVAASKTLVTHLNINCVNNVAAWDIVSSDSNGSAMNVNFMYFERVPATSNITSITLQGSDSSCIAIGSTFRLYRRK